MGRTRWLRKSHCCCQKDRYSQFSERRPEMGSQPSCTPNRIISSRASQKSGVAKPTNTKIVVTLSKIEYCRVADSTPMGTASARMIEHLDDVQEQRDRQPLADLGEHGPAVGQERAAEVQPRHRALSQFQYCTCSGLSSPYSSRSCSLTSRPSASRVLRRRSGSRAGSPGARWITMKETKVMPIRSGTASRSRRSANEAPSSRRCIAAAASARTTR